MKQLRVGIVGCGFVSQKRHIPSFRKIPKQATIVAVCDLNKTLADNVAKQFSTPKVYSNVAEMLSIENLDIVDICTPPAAHVSVAVQALEAGCNVLMEKPMALSVSDCDKMIEAGKRSGKKLSVVHNQKFYPPFLAAQKLVADGEVGKLTGMTITLLTPREEYLVQEKHWIHKLPGGIIGETGPHVIYLSLAFVKNVKEIYVSARKTSDYPWVLYDDYRINLVGENIDSTILVSHANSVAKEEVNLFGTENAVKVDMQSMIVTQTKNKEMKPSAVAASSLDMAGQTIRGVSSNAVRMLARKPMLGHDIMIQKFVESIANNTLVPVTPEEGRETVRILNEIVLKLQKK